MTLHITRWRYVSPYYDDHLAMLHDDRPTIPRSAREHALSELLWCHRRYHTNRNGCIETRDGIDDLIGMEV